MPTMIVARTVEPEKTELVEAPVPALAPGHALVRVHSVALCGTDLHIWDRSFPADLPVVQGHEFAGVVERINPDAGSPLRPGDSVTVNPSTACGRCHACTTGRFNCCERMRVLGCYEDGGMAELIAAPVGKLCPVPAGLSVETAALGEPMSIAMQAVHRGRPRAEETALVLGCGPIGVLATLYLTELGVRVVAADIDPARAAGARAFGAVETLVVDPAGEFPSAAQRAVLDRVSDGVGVPLVIEATGVPSSTVNAIRLVAHAGRIVQVGISQRDIPVPIAELALKELDLLGSRNSLDLIPDGLRLLARHEPVVRTLITHRFPLAEINDAYRVMRARTEYVGKVVVGLS